ncbi:MAG TPA: LysR family transcriptional regulator [Polyangiaceae bacterium]|nr:LysR family transcriptional regulator [Polyangiaceae bacterium]
MQTRIASELLRWDDVRLFLALCRARTVSEAARALRIDSSTVSRRLTALEETLTATLFDRNHEGIAATKPALDLLPVAEEMEAAMLRFTQAADGLEREVSGLVRIACPPDVGNVVIAPLLRELRARHPALRVEIASGEAVIDLTRREADLALRTVRPAQGDLVVTRLTSVRWVLVASAELVRELGTLRAWNDAPWIGWGARLSQIAAAKWPEMHAKEVDPVVRSDSMMVQIAAASAGVGVVLLPEPSARHNGLVPVKLAAGLRADAAKWPTDELYLVTLRALREVPRVRAVWELLLERAGGRTRH